VQAWAMQIVPDDWGKMHNPRIVAVSTGGGGPKNRHWALLMPILKESIQITEIIIFMMNLLLLIYHREITALIVLFCLLLSLLS